MTLLTSHPRPLVSQDQRPPRPRGPPKTINGQSSHGPERGLKGGPTGRHSIPLETNGTGGVGPGSRGTTPDLPRPESGRTRPHLRRTDPSDLGWRNRRPGGRVDSECRTDRGHYVRSTSLAVSRNPFRTGRVRPGARGVGIYLGIGNGPGRGSRPTSVALYFTYSSRTPYSPECPPGTPPSAEDGWDEDDTRAAVGVRGTIPWTLEDPTPTPTTEVAVRP